MDEWRDGTPSYRQRARGGAAHGERWGGCGEGRRQHHPLFFGLIGHVLPAYGLDLLERCRALVAADLPGQALRLAFGP